MDLKKYIIIIIGIITLLLNVGTNCYAYEYSQSTLVTYSVDENKLYNLILNVGEGGTVYDGDEKIENGTIIYELKVEDIKNFRIHTNKNFKVKNIILNSIDIKDNSSNASNEQYIQVKGIGGESTLDINFESIKNGVNSTEKPNIDKVGGSVDTGDNSNIALLVLLMISSIIIITRYYNKNSKG